MRTLATEPNISVVHRDDALLVVTKPAGLSTTSPGRGPSLVELVGRLNPTAPALHPTSRLDAEVTGLVTFARTRDANKALLSARRAGTYGRLYLGLASVAPEPARGTWDRDIALHATDRRLRRAVAPGASATARRKAVTDYEVRATAPAAVLLGLRPRTGRTHQLRVHAADAGCPLLGDVRYGGAPRAVRRDGCVVTARRVMLHCVWLKLPDVAGGGGTLELRAEVPDDFRAVWMGAGGADAALRDE